MPISEILQQYRLSDIKAKDENGDTILHLVVKKEELTPKEKIEILRILLDEGLDPKVENLRGRTVLHLAIAKRLKNVIDLLITHKLALDSTAAAYMIEDEHENYHKMKSQLETNEMLQKAECESAEFVEWMILKGLDIDGINGIEHSATFGCGLLLAMNYNLQHILPTLLKYTNRINYVDRATRRSLLHLFLRQNALDRYKYKSPPDNEWYLSYKQRYALSIVQTLLNRGVSPEAVDNHRNTALHETIMNEEDINIIEMIIDRTTNVNRKNQHVMTPFYISIQKWLRSKELHNEYYMRISRCLVAKGADVNEPTRYGAVPLSNGITKCHLQVVEFLRDNCADFSVTTGRGETLMHHLAKKNDNDNKIIKLFDMLISNGCEISAIDNDGNTPLHHAAYCQNSMLVKKLIEHGADVHCKNKRKETPFRHLASLYIYNTDAAKVLLENGANVDTRDIEGSTAMHLNMSYHVLQFLLKHGAEFDTRVAREKLNISNEVDDEGGVVNESKDIRLKHWIKLDVAKLNKFTRLEYENIIRREKYRNYYEKCSKEIVTLKNTFIDSRTSLYTLLHMNVSGRRAYLYNEKLQKLLESSELEEQFPEFSVLIYSSYHEATARSLLLEPAKQAWLELTEINLPDECIEHVFSFLKNSELFEVIENQSGSLNTLISNLKLE